MSRVLRPGPYLAAIAAVALAVVLRWALDPTLGDSLPFVTLFGATAAAVWVGGIGPGIAAAVAGYAAANYLFMEPRYAFGVAQAGDVVGLVAYAFTSTLIIGFGDALRKARAKVAEREELLHVTLRSIGDGVITTDRKALITDMNAVAQALTGWTIAEAQGKPLPEVFNIVNETTRIAADNPALRALDEGVIVGLANHTVLISKSGAEHPIDDSAAPIRTEDGRVCGCVLVFRDVAQQRLAEREKARELAATRLLAAIVESSEDAIISKTVEGVIQTWNAGAERIFGFTAEQALGRHISLIIPTDRLAEEELIISRLKAGHRIEHYETERLCRDGRRIVVELSISPIRDDTGGIVGASKIARDVTELREGEQRKRELLAEKARLATELAIEVRRKDIFLATLAHELRNPLAPLSHALEVVKRARGDRALMGSALATMDRQFAHMVRLIDDLLDLSRITHDRLELRQTEIELATVIQQAVEAARPLVDAAEHRLRVSLPEEPVWLRADAPRLTQVFGNLLNNSSKYTDPGGSIAIEAALDGNGNVVVAVTDSGIGISSEKLGTIFDMFTQGQGPVERAQTGLGIGLTLVRRLVEMHGGSVEARSEGDGRGSTFIVRLPTIEPPRRAVHAGAASGPRAEAGAGRRILIVDDNRDSAESLATLLTMTGNETITAHDGEAAIDAAERHRPDVILLDIGLPKMNGYDVCRHVRAQPWGRDIRTIALTGWGQEADRRRSSEAGFDGHLVKPVEYDALLHLIHAPRATAERAPGNTRH